VQVVHRAAGLGDALGVVTLRYITVTHSGHGWRDGRRHEERAGMLDRVTEPRVSSLAVVHVPHSSSGALRSGSTDPWEAPFPHSA
jgi:hypothetical protein